MGYNAGEEYDVSPKESALSIKRSFDAYYKQQKSILDRRRKDLAVLKSRAGISANTVPNTSDNAMASALDIINGQ